MSIHPTAIVSSQAKIAPDATIGPYCVIEGHVEIGAGTVVDSHARLGHRFGRLVIGRDNYIQHGATLGGPPQDISYSGDDTLLEIGDGNRIGEYVSISQGTLKGGGRTSIGHSTMLMAFVHVGHDCRIGDGVIITNSTQISGHVVVEEHALLSGLVGVSQFVRLGRYSFLTGGSFTNKDIPPYTIAEGHWARLRAVNRVALRRAGFDDDTRRNIERAVRVLLDTSLTIEGVIERIRETCRADAHVGHLIEFLQTSSRGIARK